MADDERSLVAAVRLFQARQADAARFEYPALQVVCLRRLRGFSGPPSCGASVRASCVAGACADGGRIVACSWCSATYDHDACVRALHERLRAAGLY